MSLELGSLLTALTLVLLSLMMLYVLNGIIWRGVVVPLSWVFWGDRRRTIWYHLALFPGTVIHEISHLVACWLLMVRVIEFQPFSLDPNRPPGWIRHQRTDPLRSTLIGLAPFWGGSLALLLLTRLLFPEFFLADWFAEPAGLSGLAPLLERLGQTVWHLLTQADYTRWQTWVFLYLVFSIGLQVAPSATDLATLPGGVLLVVGTLGGCYLLSLVLRIDWTALPLIAAALIWVADLLMGLNDVLLYTIALVLLTMLLLLPLAWLLARLSR
ncbi:MAG: hypothetical protein KKA73_15470 [Chloroflexi bacterium]|nr:hypothetical protein [Chloroflexota bacterium]MBU1749084.1 hypothetical protein [Chloroflexota bacterium]MBU1877595.1 hypothetical protein [Chloroflexota bacterium]